MVVRVQLILRLWSMAPRLLGMGDLSFVIHLFQTRRSLRNDFVQLLEFYQLRYSKYHPRWVVAHIIVVARNDPNSRDLSDGKPCF